MFPEFDLCLFDFNGCGNSEGDYVSLGIGEKEETLRVMEEVKLRYGTTEFLLWGRSMGAVTALYLNKLCRKRHSIDLAKRKRETTYNPEVLRRTKI